MLISDSSFATVGSPLGGPLSLSTNCGLDLKCFSLHICPKWSLIAHWRMHDIKCLQTWNNHVLSLLEIVCSGICIYHHVEQNWISHQNIRNLSHFHSIIPIVQVWHIWFTSLVYMFMLLLLTLRYRNALKWKPGLQYCAGELKGFSVTILPSICLLGWISVELQYFLIVGNFCTVLLK